MRTAAWIATFYLAVVGAATFASNVMTNTAGSTTGNTADTIAQLPSIGSLMGSTGTTAAVLDLGGAAAIYFFYLR